MQIVGKMKFKKINDNQISGGFCGMAMSMDNHLIGINEIPIRNKILIIKIGLAII